MLTFINARVIDGTGSPPVENATVIVDNGRIKAVEAGRVMPDCGAVADLKGRMLLPAFSDAHTHFGGSESLSRPGLGGRDITYDYALNSDLCLRWGVTTIRSAGDFMPDIISYRDEVSANQLHAPRILAAGRMFVARGGHPLYTVYGANESIRDNACVVYDEDTDIDAAVRDLAEAGVDWIKAFLSTINKMNYPNEAPRLSYEALRKITETAHKYGKPVMIHVESPADIEEVIDLGVDSIEHVIGVGSTCFEIPDTLLGKLRDSGIYVVPTLSGIKAHDGSLEGAEAVYPYLGKAVKAMADAGVRLGVGCDSGIPFVPCGESVHVEMELFAALGLSPMQVICMATKGNAAMLRRSDAIGTIEAGKLADIVVLSADPLSDIRNTRQIGLVMKEGRIMEDHILSL